MKRMKGCGKKTHQASFNAERSLAGFFSTKSSSHGEKLEQQEKMKKKKKWKNGCRHKFMECLSTLGEAP